MMLVEIALVSRPQTFNITLAGTPYHCRLQWNVPAAVWVLDIADQIGTPIISGIALVTGCDLLEQFTYAGIRGHLFVMTTVGPPDDVPGFFDLGVRGHVYFVPRAS
ncbi:MAG: hypothetical protein C5B60_02470 [Chloroflexi bacterium]|nr:MAG: hypothetical protein C5B60_02470 [Chloroflexota bacterium]